MSIRKSLPFTVAIAAAAVSVYAGSAAATPSVQPPFDTVYQLNFVDSASPDPVPGIPSPYSAMAFPLGDFDALLMAGHSFNDDDPVVPSSIWKIGLIRDEGHHVVGFKNDAVRIALAPGLPGSGRGIGSGLGFGPESVLFYTSPSDNGLNQLKPGSSAPDKQIDLSALAPTPIAAVVAPLGFVPQGFAGAGSLKLISTKGNFYDVALTADGSGTFDIASVSDIGKLANGGTDANGDGNRPTGLGYVAAGNPQFAQDNLFVSTCDFNTGVDSNLTAYQLASDGSPLIATARTVAANLCATGAVVDPLTGDLLFTNFYGFPALTVLKGFTVPPPTLRFASRKLNVAETAGTATVSVIRQGSTASAASVHYATSPGTATSPLNYTDVAGTLSWPAGDRTVKRFTIPVKDDGVYNGPLTIDLSLSDATGAALGAPIASIVSINNADPKPTVSLTSGNRTVTESVGSVQLTAALDKAAGVPVTVPFVFSGSAARKIDYRFATDLSGRPIARIVIAPGELSGSLNLDVIDDSRSENDETLVATMGTPINAGKGAVTANTITITDDDPLHIVAFATVRGSATEGSRGAGVPFQAIQVRLSRVSGKDVSVPVTLTGGAADARISITNTVVIPAGQVSAHAVTIADDLIHEGTQTYDFALGAPTGATLGSQQSFKLTLYDND